MFQLFTRDKDETERMVAEIKKGMPFGAAYEALMPKLPEGQTPWDLGWVRWQQVPIQWQGVVDKLAVGATSDVIAGPKGTGKIKSILSVAHLLAEWVASSRLCKSTRRSFFAASDRVIRAGALTGNPDRLRNSHLKSVVLTRDLGQAYSPGG